MSARDAESLLFLDQAAVPPTPSPSQLDAPRPCPRPNWTPRVPAPVPTGTPPRPLPPVPNWTPRVPAPVPTGRPASPAPRHQLDAPRPCPRTNWTRPRPCPRPRPSTFSCSLGAFPCRRKALFPPSGALRAVPPGRLPSVLFGGRAPPGVTLSPRTNRTRRVPHPVLIGHAASCVPGAGAGRRAAARRHARGGRADPQQVRTRERASGGGREWGGGRGVCAPAPGGERRLPTGRARRGQAPPLPGTRLVPPSRTNWTRLVPPSVLTGHVSARAGARTRWCAGRRRLRMRCCKCSRGCA